MVVGHDLREDRGRTIAQVGGVKPIDADWYEVRSQSGNGRYDVHATESGWTCSCPDHFYRGVKCKHLWAAEFSKTLRQKVRENLVIQPVEIDSCIFCQSAKLKKYGIRHNKQGDIQRFLCADCGRAFSVNIGFERMKHDPHAITTAMQLYFSGESLRNSGRSLRLLGIQVTHQTVYNWIQKYVRLMEKYLNQIEPQVSDTWRADEMFLKIKGNPKYLYALMDDETRYWIAKEVAGTVKQEVSDRLRDRVIQRLDPAVSPREHSVAFAQCLDRLNDLVACLSVEPITDKRRFSQRLSDVVILYGKLTGQASRRSGDIGARVRDSISGMPRYLRGVASDVRRDQFWKESVQLVRLRNKSLSEKDQRILAEAACLYEAYNRQEPTRLLLASTDKLIAPVLNEDDSIKSDTITRALN